MIEKVAEFADFPAACTLCDGDRDSRLMDIPKLSGGRDNRSHRPVAQDGQLEGTPDYSLDPQRG
jgi:hypothetical protein